MIEVEQEGCMGLTQNSKHGVGMQEFKTPSSKKAVFIIRVSSACCKHSEINLQLN